MPGVRAQQRPTAQNLLAGFCIAAAAAAADSYSIRSLIYLGHCRRHRVERRKSVISRVSTQVFFLRQQVCQQHASVAR